MGKQSRKKSTGSYEPVWRLAKLAGGLLVLLGILSAAVFAMYQVFTRFESGTYIQETLTNAGRDAEVVQTVIAQRETDLRDWAYALRDSGNTEAAGILESTAQGCRILGAKQLYLVDNGGLYYGSSGTITQTPRYEESFNQMQTEMVTFRKGDNIVVCLKMKPFTVDGSTFCWAVAEFDPSHYQQEMVPNLRNGLIGGEILDTDGAEFLRIAGERSLISRLSTLEFEGYDAPEDLIRQILSQEQVNARCRIGGTSYLLVSEKLPGRGWILATLDPMPTPPGLTDPLMVLYLIVVSLLATAVLYTVSLRHRERNLLRQVQEAQEDILQLQTSLDAAMKDNSVQMGFIDTISYNVRTPLNSIVGFTALAKRHIQEPETAHEYLEKVGNASAHLLSKLNEGLDATGWHRYVEDEEPPQNGEKAVRLEGKRILLVDDNALNREIGEAVLSEIGVIVECAVNGEEGFQKVAASRPGYYDLVLLDIQMPVMDGYEAARMIRRLRTKLLAEIPILAMTANVAQTDKQKAFEAGMDGYLEKPINIEKLLAAIRGALGRESASGEQYR